MSLLSVNNVSFSYPGKRALHNVSCKLKPQTITALVGPNGSGKTTLLRCIASLLTPFSGKVLLDGIDVHESPRACHEKMGYLADNFGLYENLTVTQCLQHAAAIHSLRGKAASSAVHETIKRLQLTPYKDTATKNLSRGWKQRTGVGTAIIHSPKLLLLDEPASGLDPEARKSLSDLMQKLRRQGMTILVSSHILAELEEYSNSMLILRDGHLIEKSKEQSRIAEIKTIKLVLSERTPNLEDILSREKQISGISITGFEATFTWDGDDESQTELMARLLKQKLPVVSFTEELQSMQDIYLSSLEQDRKS